MPTILDVLVPILDVLVVLCLFPSVFCLFWEWMQEERSEPPRIRKRRLHLPPRRHLLVGGMPSTPGGSVTEGGALGEEGCRYSAECLERPSEKGFGRRLRSVVWRAG